MKKKYESQIGCSGRNCFQWYIFTGMLYFLLGSLVTTHAQSNMNADGNSHRVNTTGGQYSEYKIPTTTNYSAVTFTLEGADGGRRKVDGLCLAKGGAGATVTVKFDIGTQTGQLKKGGIIRFIPGYNGSSNAGSGIEAGGGGGGTGILYRAPSANVTCSVPSLNLSDASSCWVLLGVAGGGGGAYSSGLCGGVNGKGGNSGTNGTDGTGAFGGHGGTNGNGGNNNGGGGGGGGGYLTDGNGDDDAGGGQKGSFTGGFGGFGSQDGDWGYGGGGGSNRGGGGGGGFSGGGSGDLYNAGGGGGSFANSSAVYSKKISGGTESTPDDGYVDYIFGVGSTTPVAVCKNITVAVDANGHGIYYATDLDGGSYDPNGDPITFKICGLDCYDSITVNCNDPWGTGSIPLLVNDGNENGLCFSNVQLEDNIAPVVTCKSSITLTLDAMGNATIVADDLIASVSDNCSIETKTLSKSTFNCTNIGNNTVTVTVSDPDVNSVSCASTVTVKGYTFSCKPDFNVTVPSGACEVFVNLAAPNFSSGCGYTIKSRVCDGSQMNCTAIDASNKSGNYPPGDYLVQWLLYNAGGTLISGCFTYFNVLPNADKPTALCKNATVQLDATGQVTITPSVVDNGSTDLCGPVTESLNISSFDCSKVGNNTVTLTVTNSMGNTKTCTSTVTVQDKVTPVALCKNNTVSLNAAGQGSILAAAINNGSTDACGIATLFLSKGTFNCSNFGPNTVTLSVTDVNNNTSSCTATVTVADAIAPTVTCKAYTANLDAAGSASVATGNVFQSGSDNCGTVNLVSVSPNSFNCANIGANTVALTVNDGKGNTNTCTATVTVADAIVPTVVCKSYTANLDNAGSASITTANVFQSGSDNCGTVNQVSVSPNAFNCAHIGANTVTLTVNDGHGNTATCSATVTVKDVTPPTADCKNITVPIDNSGFYSIVPSDVAGVNIFEACGALPNMEIDISEFTCSDLGQQTVTLTLTDNSENSSSCTAIVTVQDVAPPQMNCKINPVIVELDANGTGFITFEGVDNGSYDNCSGNAQGGNLSLSMTGGSYTCADLGANLVTLTGTDESNNSSSCTATILVQDHIAPAALCKNVTVYLDINGNGSTSATEVDNNSVDACGVQTITLSNSTFHCSDLGSNTVVLSVTDYHSNSSTCTATVTVADAISPTVTCKAYTANLDAAGSASVTTSNVYQSGADNCGTVNQVSVAPNSFNCSNIGANTVTLTVNDGHGNTNTCNATVTVLDAILPTVNCKAYTANLDATGAVTITTGQVFQSGADNCGIVNQVSVLPNSFNCAQLGVNIVTLTVNDGHGNTAACTASVTVADVVAPTLTCKAYTTSLNTSGLASVSASNVYQSGSDNCGTVNQVSVAPSVFSCTQKGPNVVVLTVNDSNGNTSSCTAVVTVVDNLPPTALCKNVSLTLNTAGTVGTNALAVNNNSTDNCGGTSGIQSLNLSKTAFNCTHYGQNTVILTVTDNSANTSTCSATITIGYAQPPVAKCKNAIVVLSSAGNGSITAAGINNASTDLCSANGLTLALSKTTFNCSNIGPNVVTLTVTNVAGLSSTCTGTVTVKDLTKPVAKCKPVAITVPEGTTVTLPAAAVNNVSTDACTSPPNSSLSPNQFTCANAGANTVVLTVSDASNNNSTCSAVVTVTCGGGAAPEKAIGTQAFADYTELMDLFPNPAADKVNVRLSKAVSIATPVTILDNTGRTLYSGWIAEGSSQLQVDLTQSRLNSGIYLISVKLADRVQTKSLVIFRD